MNLKWNPDYRRFEVEFHNFTEEQPMVKDAGFKTDGPPAWVWWSVKSEPLTKIREKKPTVLTINPDAKTEYAKLKEVEDRNAATKKLLADQKKALKKKLKTDKQDALKPDEYLDEVLQFVCFRVNSKPLPQLSDKYVPPLPPEKKCVICETSVYDYEYSGFQACMWCQKIALDIEGQVC